MLDSRHSNRRETKPSGSVESCLNKYRESEADKCVQSTRLSSQRRAGIDGAFESPGTKAGQLQGSSGRFGGDPVKQT